MQSMEINQSPQFQCPSNSKKATFSNPYQKESGDFALELVWSVSWFSIPDSAGYYVDDALELHLIFTTADMEETLDDLAIDLEQYIVPDL